MASGTGDLPSIMGDAINLALKDHEGGHHTRRSSAPAAPSLNSMPHAADELAHFIHEVIQSELRRRGA